MKYLSQIDIAPEGGFKGFGKLGLEETDPSSALGIFSNFISSAIGLMTIIGIIWFVFIFFIGAIGMIGAGGDKQALEGARKKIVTGVIGLIVTIAAVFIIQLIGFLIGVDVLNLEKVFTQITGNQ